MAFTLTNYWSSFLSVRNQASHLFIHRSTQRGWLLVPCSPGQDLSLGDCSRLCSPIMPCIPSDLPWCSVGRHASQPVRRGTSIHPDSRSSIHPSIYTFERLTSCTPMAQNKASLWGTVVGFVPPLVMPHILQTCPGSPLKAQGTGRSTGLSTPPFPFLFLILSLFQTSSPLPTSPPPHLVFFFFGWRVSLSSPKLLLMPFLSLTKP